MKKQWRDNIIKSIALLCFVSWPIGYIFTREVRNPLTLHRGYGYLHYQLPRPKDQETLWNIDTWGAGYYRSANKAFPAHESEDNSLAGIFFGTGSFTGNQAFAFESFFPGNPFLQFSTINPLLEYDERGAFFGLTVEREWCVCDQPVRFGVRCNIPFRDICVELDDCCDLENSLRDVALQQREMINNEGSLLQVLQGANYSFAYRLDFLSALRQTVNGNQELFLKYSDPTRSNHISMNDIDVTDQTNPNSANAYPIHVIAIDQGVPPAPFALVKTGNAGSNVVSLPNLSADGSGLANGARAHFASSIDYTPLATNLANQKRLWVVPTAKTIQAFNIMPDGLAINNNVQLLLNMISTSAIEFFKNNGIVFNTQRTVGPGDLDMEIYANTMWRDWMFEPFIGARFPTGKKIKDPGRLLKLPAGNNGHYEVKAGLMGGWQGLDWLHIKVDTLYAWALRGKEKVAASFAGATIKNIGPTIDADISWQYFLGDIDLTFLVSCNPRVGINIGYELYVKTKDSVHFNATSAIDLFGVVKPLDPSILEKRTNVVDHKICAEIFHRGRYWEVVGGWTRSFAGKNAFHDAEWYLSLLIYF